jgi:glutamine synthetase
LPVYAYPDQSRAEYAKGLQKKLTADGVECVVITVVDNAGITLVKTFPVSRLASVVQRGVGLSPVFDAFLVDDSTVDAFPVSGPAGDLRLIPDPYALRPLAAQPGWAWGPADKYDVGSGEPVANCQRTFARRMQERAQAAGLELRMAFEIECFLGTDDDGELHPAYTGPAYGAMRFTQMSELIRELAAAFAQQQISVDQIHPEFGSGQLEVSVQPSGPVAAADTTVLARQTIRALAAKHGYQVSFAPVVMTGQVGNGNHCHLSLWRAGRNLFSAGAAPGQMDATAEAFTAGILAELGSLAAVGCPSAASYLRLQPAKWAGAYACWGVENREAAIRFVASTAHGLNPPEGANVEVKCFDGSANPYLLVGSLIAAGLAGLDEGLRLPEPIGDDPAGHPEADLRQRGIERLPQSLDAAVDCFAKSAILREAMGSGLFSTFEAVRRGEAELFAGTGEAEIIAAHRWRY